MTAAPLSPRERRDLFAAAAWIADDNPAAAEALIDAVEAAAERIGTYPRIGAIRANLLDPQYRFLAVAGFPYLIVYNAAREPPEIVRIVHGARNLPRVLRDLHKGWTKGTRMTIDGAYSGLRVLDFGQGIAAPYCAMLLAMHGAEVVKLEPVAGDWSRGLGTAYGDHTAMSAHYNRGKRSIALDLKSSAARDIALDLACRADIVIENNRPGAMARLGLGYDALAALNPRLLYVSISGFGQEGPYATLPCTDSVAQAYSGLVSLNAGNDGMPHRVGAIIIDTLTGLYAAQAVGVALYARERRGIGRRIAVSLAECGAAILGQKLAEHVLENGAPRVLNVPTGAYRTQDGGWVMIALIREEQFTRLVAALGRPDLAVDPRYAGFAARAEHAAPLFDTMRGLIAAETTASCLEKLRAADILADRINGFDDWLADPHIVATGGVVAVAPRDMPAFKVPRTPGLSPDADTALAPAPHVGEHGRAILAELGLPEERVAALAAEGIVRLP